MNKLFTKIATAFVGIAMAIGAGVAVGSNSEFRAAHAAEATFTKNSKVYKTNESAPGSNNAGKFGTGSVAGSASISKVASGATSLSFYAVGWKSETVRLKLTSSASGVKINGTAASTGVTIDVASYDAISGSATSYQFDYTDNDKYTFSLTGVSGETTFTLAATSGKRFVIWNVQYDTGGGGGGGDDYNLKFGTNDVKISSTNVNATDSNNKSWNIVTAGTSSFTQNADYSQVGSSGSPASSITFTGTLSSNATKYTVSALSIKMGGFSNTAGTVTLKVGDTAATATSIGSGSLSGTSDVTITNSSSGTGKVIVITVTSISRGVKVYGINYTFEAAKFTVSYNGNNNTSGTVPTDSAEYNSGATVTVKGNTGSLARTGYTYGGWNTNAQGTGTTYVAGTGTFTISDNTTLYAKWNPTTYNITYSLDGGTHGSTHPDSATYDTVFSVSAPTKTGHTFTGWTVTSGLNSSTAKWGTTNNPATAISNSSTLCVNGTNAVYFKNISANSSAVTLTANWSTDSYSVTGSISHGSLSVPGKIEYGGTLNVTIVADTNYGVPEDQSDISVTGATISSYTVTDETHGVVGLSNATGPVTVTATCSPLVQVFTVTYDPNDGVSPKTTEEVIEDGHPTFPTPTRSGYNLKGWQVDGEGTVYTNPNAYTVTTDVEFVAKWAAVYTVTFNSSGGSSSPESIPVEDGLTFTFPSPGTKTHYSFLGWSSDGGTTKYDVEDTSPAVVGNIAYTAYWEEDEYCTVTYSSGSHGTGSYAHTHQYLGTYTLLAFNLLDGVAAESGYQFKNYTVGGSPKDPGDTFTLAEATTIIVNFELAPTEETATKTMSQIVSENGFTVSSGSNVTCYTEFSLDELVTVSTTGTPNCGSFWGTSPNNDWRLYQNQSGNITISVPTGCELEKITINYSVSNTGALFDGSTQIASGTEYNVSGTSATYTVGNTGSATNGQVRITSISVTYVITAPIVTYTITYNGNGATDGSMDPTTGTTPKVADCEFTKTDFDFERWNTRSDGEGDDYEVGTTVSEDITLYAIWHEHVEPIGGNVTMEGITSTESVTVNTLPAIKCGASSTAGEMKLTLTQANMTKIKVYIAGWGGDTNNTINVSIDNGATISQGGSPVESIDVIQDDGIGGTGKSYTLEEEETTYKFVFDIANAPANTEITLTASKSSKCRFVVWGATDLFAETFANEFMTNMTCHNGDTPPTFAEGYSWAYFDSFYGSLDAEEQGRLQGAQASEIGSIIQQAMARYDYIEGRYNPDNLPTSAWKNFIGRSVTPIGNGRIMINLLTSQATNTSIIVIVTVAVSAIAVGGYFFLRKKKED